MAGRAVRTALLALAIVAVPAGSGAAETGGVSTQAGVLAQRVAVSGKPVVPGFAIDFVGVLWKGEARGGSMRFRHGGGWGAWLPLRPDGMEVDGEFASALVAAGGADAYQVRVPRAARAARAVAINASHRGSSARSTAFADGIVSRAEWGADESLRFDQQGNEVWPPAYYPAQVMTVHHTATRNNDADPAATVRAIYRYHTVDRGWGDIGYHYLIDESGRVYEGRWSGTDGDPAHDSSGNMVTAAHVGGFNSGNLGIALLGTLRTRPPTAAARATLESVLADLAGRHGLDPLSRSHYVNPITADTRDVDTISGHRDWESTECPGGALYEQLPSVRANVATMLSPPSSALHVGDLDGLATGGNGTWSATVTALVLDEAGAPFAGATVVATWGTGATSSCATGAGGSCALTVGRIKTRTASVTFTVTSISAPNRAYDSGSNTDPEGDSTGTSIVVAAP
jgi:hypothetical protein